MHLVAMVLTLGCTRLYSSGSVGRGSSEMHLATGSAQFCALGASHCELFPPLPICTDTKQHQHSLTDTHSHHMHASPGLRLFSSSFTWIFTKKHVSLKKQNKTKTKNPTKKLKKIKPKKIKTKQNKI